MNLREYITEIQIFFCRKNLWKILKMFAKNLTIFVNKGIVKIVSISHPLNAERSQKNLKDSQILCRKS